MPHIVDHVLCTAESNRSRGVEYYIYHHHAYNFPFYPGCLQPQYECQSDEWHWLMSGDIGSNVLPCIPLSLIYYEYYIYDVTIKQYFIPHRCADRRSGTRAGMAVRY